MSYKEPYIKVTWIDTPEAFTSERLKRAKEILKERYNTRHIKIVTKVISNKSDKKLKALEISESILDPNYQKTLMKEFIKVNNISVNHELIERLDNKINQVIFDREDTRVKYNRWYIKNVEFSNFLSFGEGNVINFEELEGITVVESNPKNFGGKSTSTVDLLMFLFFATTTKTDKFEDIFNRFTDVDRVFAKATITIDGDDYIIERSINRKLGRSGSYNVKSDLDFSKILKDGSIQNLSGEQRRETEKYIEKAIGTKTDFLSTILTTGYNLEELIDSKPTARGQILTKFIGLDSLKEKEEICREQHNEYKRTMVSNTHNKFNLQQDIETYHTNIIDKDKEIDNTEKRLVEVTENKNVLEKKKENLLSEKHGDVDEALIRTNPKTIQTEIDEINDKIKKVGETLKNTIVKEPKNYYLEDDHDKLKDEIRENKFEVKQKGIDIERIQSEIKQLKDGSICLACKRPLENVDHTKEIEDKEKEIKTIQGQIDLLNRESLKLQEDEVKHSELKKEYDLYEKNKLVSTRYELEIKQFEIDKSEKIKKLEYFEANKKKHERNLEIDKQLIILNTQIETAVSDVKQCNILIERYTTEIKTIREKINTNRELIKKIELEETVCATYEAYQTVFGKTGISKTILRDMIPFLNNELEHLLDDSCFFKLELSVNGKNELDFHMIDTETRVVKSINAGSGYEKTIASLALRSVLTKVSSLPKPNIVVMDEVFGKIADENIEMVGEFFKKIKKYFDHIIVISHNPLIRTWSDNLLMIEKSDNISSIHSIKTKIS
jgi:DNA repair exonuclease SbcCD ATPase subunit